MREVADFEAERRDRQIRHLQRQAKHFNLNWSTPTSLRDLPLIQWVTSCSMKGGPSDDGSPRARNFARRPRSKKARKFDRFWANQSTAGTCQTKENRKQEDMKDKVVSFRIAAALAWFLVFAAPVWAAGLPNDAGLAATTVSHAVTGPSSGAQPWEPRDGAVVWPSTDPLGEVLGYGHFPICSGTGCSEDRDCWGGPTCACNGGACTSSHTHPTPVHVGDDSGGLRLSTQGWSSMRTPRMLLLLGPKGVGH